MSAGIVLLCVAFKLLVFSRTLSQSVTVLDVALKTPSDSSHRLSTVLERVRQFWSQLCDVSALLVTICFLCGLYFLVVGDAELSVSMLGGVGTALLLWSALVLVKVITLQKALHETAVTLDESNCTVEEPIRSAATKVSLANGILLALHGFGLSLSVAMLVLWTYLS